MGGERSRGEQLPAEEGKGIDHGTGRGAPAGKTSRLIPSARACPRRLPPRGNLRALARCGKFPQARASASASAPLPRPSRAPPYRFCARLAPLSRPSVPPIAEMGDYPPSRGDGLRPAPSRD